MKKCPKCLIGYNDEMVFCLQDGIPLIADSSLQKVSFSENLSNLPPTVWSGSLIPPPGYEQQNRQNYQPLNQMSPQSSLLANFLSNVNGGMAARPQYTLAQRFFAISIFTVVMTGIGCAILFGVSYFQKPGFSNQTSFSVYNTPDTSRSVNQNSTDFANSTLKTDSSKPMLPPDRNGFIRDRVADLKLTDYPRATNGLIANYKKSGSSDFIVIEAISYPSSNGAKDGFSDHLAIGNREIMEGGMSDGTPYAYYKNRVDGTTYYHLCAQSGNQVSDYFSKSLESVKAFLK